MLIRTAFRCWTAARGFANQAACGFAGARAVAILAVVIFLLFWHCLAGRDLWGSHEARAAQNAQRMLDDESWGLPRLFDDHYDLQKPPLYYWLTAIAGWLNGDTAMSCRSPAGNAFRNFLCVPGLFRSAPPRPAHRRLPRCPHSGNRPTLHLAGRTARIDMPLTLAVTVAVLAVVESQRWRIIRLRRNGGGLLLKGPIGLVLPMAIILLHALCLQIWKPAAQARVGAQPLLALTGSQR